MRNSFGQMILFLIIFTFLNINISADETEITVEENDIKYEIVKYSNKIYYEGNNTLVKKEIDLFTKKKVNFKAQTSFDISVKLPPDVDVIQKIEDILLDIESFNDIPYKSKRTGKTTPLFKDISVLHNHINENGNRIVVLNATISPFKPATMIFEIIIDNDFIMFKAYNIDKVKYWILSIVDEKKMVMLFAGELNKKTLKCYGLGVADTGSFFIFNKVIEEEFNGRAEAIINWFHSMLKTKLSTD